MSKYCDQTHCENLDYVGQLVMVRLVTLVLHKLDYYWISGSATVLTR